MWKIAIEKRSVLGVAFGAAVLSAAPISLHWSPATAPSLSIDRADARVGHPLSPGSVAGVHRRVDRRTARRATYGGAVAAGTAGTTGSSGLYSYAPAATAAAATNTATQEYKYPTGRSVNEGGMGYNVQSNSTLATESPELYAACLNRTFGACPAQ